MCSEGLSQCLRECLCPCLDLIRILAHTVAGHITGVKVFWQTLERVTAEDGLEQGDQRQLKDSSWEGLPPRKQMYNPILSSLVSSSSLVAVTICSSPFLRDRLSCYIVQAALAVLYMALKDIWKYLNGLWSSGKEGGFGLLSRPRGFRGGIHVFNFSEYSSLSSR